jgi:hypothetical protein
MAYAPPERADRLTPFKHFEKTRDAIVAMDELAECSGRKWKRQMLLEHGQEGSRLLGFAVGVHRRLLDQRVEPMRTRRP